MTEHQNVFVALAAAQQEMEPARKTAMNPAFRSKYADLASVVEACFPALNRHGVAVHHYTKFNEHGQFMTTALVHGSTGTSAECDVPLIVDKQNMQGWKSASTYAKRIGLESVTGIAPEDDDGNAAAKNPPAKRAYVHQSDPVSDTPPQYETEHDADGVVTGHMPGAHTPGALTQAWMDGIKDKLPDNANPRQHAEAVAAQLITDLDKYKTDRWLSRYLDSKVKIIDALSARYSDLHAAVKDAIGNAHERIKGEEYDPSDFEAPGDLRSQLERSLEIEGLPVGLGRTGLDR